jgi:hypothetical protein
MAPAWTLVPGTAAPPSPGEGVPQAFASPTGITVILFPAGLPHLVHRNEAEAEAEAAAEAPATPARQSECERPRVTIAFNLDVISRA